MDFTKEELYEIEKLFDAKAGEILSQTIFAIDKIGMHSKEDAVIKKLLDNLLDGHSHYFDVCRNISNKTRSMRNYEIDSEVEKNGKRIQL